MATRCGLTLWFSLRGQIGMRVTYRFLVKGSVEQGEGCFVHIQKCVAVELGTVPRSVFTTLAN